MEKNGGFEDLEALRQAQGLGDGEEKLTQRILLRPSRVAFFPGCGFAEFVLLAFTMAFDAAGSGGGWGCLLGGFKAGNFFPGDGQVQALLDDAEMIVGLGGDEADRGTRFAGPSGAADAVGVVVGRAGEFVVDHGGE